MCGADTVKSPLEFVIKAFNKVCAAQKCPEVLGFVEELGMVFNRSSIVCPLTSHNAPASDATLPSNHVTD